MGHSLNVKSKNQWNPGFKWVTTHTVSRWSVSGHPLSHKKRKDSRRTNIKKTISLPFLFELDGIYPYRLSGLFLYNFYDVPSLQIICMWLMRIVMSILLNYKTPLHLIIPRYMLVSY